MRPAVALDGSMAGAAFEAAVGGRLVAQALKQITQHQANDQAIETPAPATRRLQGRASAHIPTET